MAFIKLGEAFQFNPRTSLNKGATAPFVEMAALEPYRRDVYSSQVRKYKSGPKFLDGDVLMARITPSLENGKTSIYRARATDADTAAFGSTEFIIVRGREGISDSQFAYYLLTCEAVRARAIASMNGSSGRQRVQLDVLSAIEVDLPPLVEQRAIAGHLGLLDDKITSNRRAAHLLLKIAKSTIGYEGSAVRLREIVTLHKGLSYKGAGLDDGSTGGATPMINLGNFTRNGDLKHSGLKWYTGEYRHRHVVNSWDLVVSNTDLTQARELLGRGFIVPPTLSGAIHTHHTWLVRFSESSWLGPLLWAQLQSSQFRDRAKSFATGTTVAALPADALLDFEIRIPSNIDSLLPEVHSMIEKSWQLDRENERLQALKEYLRSALLARTIRRIDAVGV